MKRVYHYTNIHDSEEILYGENSGLQPDSKITDDSEERGTFALLHNLNQSWNDISFLPIKYDLEKTIGPLLLEIKLGESDDVVVLERAHSQYSQSLDYFGDVKERYPHLKDSTSSKDYLESMIPLERYLENPKYVLPEIFIRSTIPPGRIDVPKKQRLLEDCLKIEDGQYSSQPLFRPKKEQLELARKYVERIPDLENWFEKFKSRE